MITIDNILDSKKLNSLTKYPSILTYHTMDETTHCLREELTQPLPNQQLYATEKIDGENIRILILNDDYVIGGRKDWLYAKGDRAISQGLKDKIKFLEGVAENIIKENHCLKCAIPQMRKDTLYCIYGEFYGFNIQRSSKHYTTQSNTFGFRVFDSWNMPVSELEKLLDMNEDQCASWRENNQQPWEDIDWLKSFCFAYKLERVPYLDDLDASLLGNSFESAYDFLNHHVHTDAQLDSTDKKSDKPEGIVLRSFDRSFITKLRFEDYELTYRKQKKEGLKCKNTLQQN